jgi:hypothetical protein
MLHLHFGNFEFMIHILETQLAACKARITMLEETNKDCQNTIQLLTAKLGIPNPTIRMLGYVKFGVQLLSYLNVLFRPQVVSTQMFCCSLLVFA